ncbi:MAG TPA: hypothetical protein VFM18_12995, partial [Methanosarcina sp.]|nr:hypothetical protein [Methanosarcina sp.]
FLGVILEPSSGSAVAGLTITVGTVSLVGTLLGMHYDALLFGLFGGLIFLSRCVSTTRSKAITGAISSALLAGVFSPILVNFLYSLHESLKSIDEDTMRRAASMIIGGGWQVVIPTAVQIFGEWLRGWLIKDTSNGDNSKP